MKQVSQAYKESMAKNIRNRSYVEVRVFSGDESAATDGTWSTGDTPLESWSETKTLSKGNPTKTTMYTCERNRCLFGDQWQFVRKDTQPREGVVTTYNKSGLNTGVELTKTFTKPHFFPGLTIYFDDACKEFPNRIYISYHDANNKVLFATPDGIKVTQPIQYFPCIGYNVSKVVIRTEQSLNDRRGRIKHVVFGIQQIFGNEEIQKLRVKKDVDPISRRAPKTEVEFSILDFDKQYDFDNPSGIWSAIDEHAPVSVQFGYEISPGNIEWLQPDKYVLHGRPAYQDNVATFKATSSLEAHTEIFKKSVFRNNWHFNDYISELVTNNTWLLSHGGISAPDNSDFMGCSYFKPMKVIDCLQQLAHASCMTFYVDSADTITFKKYTFSGNYVPVATLTERDIIRRGIKASKLPMLGNISGKQYTHKGVQTPDGKPGRTEVLFYEKEKDIFTGDKSVVTIKISFDPMDPGSVGCVSTGGEATTKAYTQYAEITLTKGNSSKPDDYALAVGLPLVTETSDKTLYVNAQGEDDFIDNPLIASKECLQKVMEHEAKYLSLRKTYDITYRGNPEIEVGDIISFPNAYGQQVTGLVLVHELSFNGAISGELKLKVLEETTTAATFDNG